MLAFFILLVLAPPTPVSAYDISYGQSFSTTLTKPASGRDVNAEWEFYGSQGDQVRLEATSTGGGVNRLKLYIVYVTGSGWEDIATRTTGSPSSSTNSNTLSATLSRTGRHKFGVLTEIPTAGSRQIRGRLTLLNPPRRPTATPRPSSGGRCSPSSRLRRGDWATNVAGFRLFTLSSIDGRGVQEYGLDRNERLQVLSNPTCYSGRYYVYAALCEDSNTRNCHKGYLPEGSGSNYFLAPASRPRPTATRRPSGGSSGCSPRTRLRGTSGVRNITGRWLDAVFPAGTDLTVDWGMSAGETTELVSGPDCVNGQYWIMIAGCFTSATGNVHCRQGFVPEGRGNTYYLEPAHAPRATTRPRATRTPRPTPTPRRCYLAPRLSVGGTARNARRSAKNMRSRPGLNASIAGRLQPGAVADVIDGPVQADQFYWWKLRRGSTVGWTAEGGNCDYWLEPVRGGSSGGSPGSSNPGLGGVSSISYGQTKTGRLNDSNFFDDWSFNARAGDVITITMDATSGNLDPLLRLYDSGGNGLTEDDDGGSGRNARISRFRIRRSGRHNIHAERYAAGQSGAYRLRLTREASAPAATTRPRATSTPRATSISYGQTKTGRLSSTNLLDQYTFNARAGDVVTISLDRTSGTLDPSLRLRNPSGAIARVDSDSGTGNNAVIRGYRIPTTGRYTIEPKRQSGSVTAGSYRLRLTKQQPATATPRPTATPAPLTIRYGQTVTGSLNNARPYREYALMAAAGDVVRISMTRRGGDLHPWLKVWDDAGNEIARGDDSGYGSYALIDELALPRAGRYLIQAHRKTNRTGSYNLSVSLVEPTATPPPTDTPTPAAQTISSGDRVTGDINMGDPWRELRFHAEAGELIDLFIQRAEGDLVPQVYLVSAESENLAGLRNDSRSPSLRIADFPAPYSGEYTIYIGHQCCGSGSYELRLKITPLPTATPTLTFTPVPSDTPTLTPTPVPTATPLPRSIAYGQTASGELTNWQPYVAYALMAQAGHVVRIRMDATGGSLDPLLKVWDESGNKLATDDDSGGDYNALIEELVISRAGRYLIQAHRNGSGTGSFRLKVTRLELPTDTPAPTDTPVPTEIPTLAARTIAFGQSANGELTDAQSYADYVLMAQAGDIARISMEATSGSLDPLLKVWDESGNKLATDDDSGGGFNALIERLVLPRSGRYLIQAHRLNSGTGDYRLVVKRLASPTDTPAASATIAPPILIAYGQSDSGSVGDDSEWVDYIFAARAGDIITITMNRRSGDLDSAIELLDSRGARLAYQNLGGSGKDAAVKDFRISRAGNYTIRATRYQGRGSGEYALALRGGPPPTLTPATTDTPAPTSAS